MSSKPLRIGFVGAGFVNFGGVIGNWNHAKRIENIGNVEVVAIADAIPGKAEDVLKKKLTGEKKDIYANCKVFRSHTEMLDSVKMDAVIIGTFPSNRGSFESDKDLELSFVKAGVHIFVEKPISLEEPNKVIKYASEVERLAEENGVITAVGYMFRYHAAVQKMKDLISKHKGRVMAFNARFYFAYSLSDRPQWWNVETSGGPIIEQGTHFCDLARYIVGEIDEISIRTMCLNADDPSGAAVLSDMAKGLEDEISPSQRVPRVTSSQWRFQNGAIGSFMHTIALQGSRYESHIDVLMDGLRMTLYEPYHPECKLLVRDKGSDHEVSFDYGDADPFERELRVFLDAVRTGRSENILSTYKDAARTYALTWAIREAGNR